MKKLYSVSVLGKNGYVGKELSSLLKQHPNLHHIELDTVEACLQNDLQLDVVFLATPAEVSIKAALKLIPAGIKVIDLSGAFRLSVEEFTQWYGFENEASFLIEKACYGLSPWAKPQSDAQLIANPGCYATAALMALMPLSKEHLIDTHSIIIDAKSGVSGAGKKAVEHLMFCEITNNFYPYKIGKHQHTPEIEKALYHFSRQEHTISLTTSLLPMPRGIAMAIYLKAAPSFSSDKAIRDALLQAYHKAYDSYPLLRYREVGQEFPEEDQKILALNQVIQTPYCHVGYFVKKGQIILFSSIDNLLKGASSQAIENINALYELPLYTGLMS